MQLQYLGLNHVTAAFRYNKLPLSVDERVRTTLGNARSSVTMLWLAPGDTSMRYELLLAGVAEPEQYSPAPPANSTCMHTLVGHPA